MVFKIGHTLSLDLQTLVEELRMPLSDCHRPEGELCVQCKERSGVADKLEEILREHGIWAEK